MKDQIKTTFFLEYRLGIDSFFKTTIMIQVQIFENLRTAVMNLKNHPNNQ